jgi:glutathione S-transferase
MKLYIANKNYSSWSLRPWILLKEIGHPVWPRDFKNKAHARSMCAEMHSGFTYLRSICTMNCGVRIQLNEMSLNLLKDIDRVNELLLFCLKETNGSFLFEDKFTAADAFFAPFAFRMQTYQLNFNPIVQNYFLNILKLKGIEDWYSAAISETFRDQGHDDDDDLIKVGQIIQDFRS